MWRPSRTLTRRVLPGIALGGLLLLALRVLTAPVPDFAQVRADTPSSEATLRDRHGAVIERLRLDRTRRMLDWVPLDAISPQLLRAVVASEDRRFWWHPGIDPIGIGSALIDNLHRQRPRGASTISMQLAGLLAEPPLPRNWRGKLQQMRMALALELRWSKREILEAWLNRLPFRGELVGIDAAARGLLAKGPDGLDAADAAVLAALIRAPSANRATLARRACASLRALQADAACAQSDYLALGLPARPYPLPGVDDAPHLARRLLRKSGEVLQTSVDGALQRFASESLRTHLAELAERNVEDGAVIVLDNRSGEVLAYVGSSGELSGAAAVDGVAAQRQPGSTLKPLLYGLAIDRDLLSASSVLDDSPLALNTPSGLYIPQDYDRDFRGAVSLRTALGASLNVPAVRALSLLGVPRFLSGLREFGLVSMQRDADHYGFGLALGAAETNLLELANAYRALANGGRWSAPRFTPAAADTQPAQRQVLGAAASFIIADILADPVARAPTFGFSSPLSTHGWAAVKTGTSKGMRDNWAIGFTDRYTVGVWVGNFSGAAMWDVSGITGAAPVWRDIVEHLHAGQASRAPRPPAGVQQRQVIFQPAIEATRQEWFSAAQAGVGPLQVRLLDEARAQLIMPPDAATIAPDPDIPQARQSLLLQASGAGKLCLFLDNKAVAPCGTLQQMQALPAPGRHQLELRDRHGHVLDVHRFEVRALQTAAAATR
ncbi:penicillin-binding protein 1C [Uliginosibacterium sediminicola]|uniref:peptidoglycan glycosyltransferase n=1 Tax=Uliginosibacterium sediminicola TaxID=2024550 RepID=A0ABU9YU63_9RHOO